MGRGNPKHKYKQGDEWIESSPEKDLGALVDKKFNMTQPYALTGQKDSWVWAAAKSAGASWLREGILPLHYSLISSGLPK